MYLNLFGFHVNHWSASIALTALAAGLVSCQPQTPTATAPGTPGAPSERVSISGAGASFPAPLYQRWFAEYNKQNPNIQISYQSVGSGAGVNQFVAQTVDFGATDAPLTQQERDKFPAQRGRPIQLPMTGGALVFAYNLPGVDNLRLSRQAYCGIAQGNIKTWNDPQIAQQNPGVNLPNTPISFIHRSDGSGTTFIFTNHLESACPQWQAGAGKSVSWPAGIGAKGNEGVTAQVQQTQGAIGYVEYAYARENKLQMAVLENQAGNYITPEPGSAASAIEGAQIPEDFALLVPDPKGEQAYPIVGLTWLLLYEQYDNPAKAQAMKNVVEWALSQGDKYAEELGYLPLPDDVSQKVIAALDTIKVAQGQ
ncbi:phosphate ABC transporter substrate-binding protein PstS [Chlorogloeopsis sp. ULAP01]|uniref:phosphate ABC transporter substrate-binding protein PstS n=1 Tax=Chlorogloeopsis sp. ULAP01 TaxID=3056483 RepID=UPI0025AB52B8|nr:phosphate ABC transporter substrate-binding protein PstS [Chlorogloeopsis sp. ULAP01]MDM9383151.1 phosphate ABC transporter substrate-binding protein PstS [Chlorogloeopsis sp. ULAP01]